MPIIKKDFAVLHGTKIEQYILSNANGMEVRIITFGGIITNLTVPDRNGKWEDVVLGYHDPQDYFNGNPHYFGAVIGRYGNRIAKGTFTLDGISYQLPINNGPNTLHGGSGFDKRIWMAAPVQEDIAALKLHYYSKDGEEGFPGNLSVNVTYILKDDNSLEIHYEATTDKKTVLNLTQHSYFNLSGHFDNTILDHELSINANYILSIDDMQIPTGELMPVHDTPFDFTSPKPIGKEINTEDIQLEKGAGYDHCWVFAEEKKSREVQATLYHATSGRYMELLTDQPGVQFYSGNFIDGTQNSKTGGKYEKHSGMCLETQHFPNAPNKPSFPSTVLNPHEVFTSATVYRFSVK